MAFKISTFNLSDTRGAKLTSIFNASVADGSFPATKEKPDKTVVPTTVEDYIERSILNSVIDSWIDKDATVSIEELRPLLKSASTQKLIDVKALLETP